MSFPKGGYMVFGLFASSTGFRQLTTLYKAHQKKCSGNARWLYFFAVRGCICLQPLCHKKALIVGVYFSALNFSIASEKIYPHLFRRAAGRVGCTFLLSAPTLRSGFFLRSAVPHPQEYAVPTPMSRICNP